MITTTIKERWKNVRSGRPWLLPLIILIVLVLLGGVIIALSHKQPVAAPEKVLPHVDVKPLSELINQATITKTAVFEPAKSAPLVSRTGGRVTAVNVHVGDHVQTVATIVQIDGAGEPSVARVQAMGATAALQAFTAIRQQALASADTAIGLAEINLKSAQSNTPLTAETAAKSREVADTSVQQAQFALTDAQEKGIDSLIRSADLALQTAQLTQDQATLARKLASQQATDARLISAQNLTMAQVAKKKLLADLESQRVGLTTQLKVAQEQVRLAQVTAPFAGEITNLTVKVGDFIQPGQTVGEVNALAGARITLTVSEGVRNQLSEGQTIPLEFGSQQFSGTVTHLGSVAPSTSAQWPVEIFINTTPEPIQPGSLVTVTLPVAPRTSNHVFIPLDSTTVRQNGVIIFTVDTANVVHEHVITPLSYEGDYIEAQVDLPADALVVITNNRNLREGDTVTR